MIEFTTDPKPRAKAMVAAEPKPVDPADFGEFEEIASATGPMVGDFSELGWTPPKKAPSFRDWAADGVRLRNRHHAVLWAIGDWLRYGESTFGESYVQAAELTGYSGGFLRDCKWVASQFPDLSSRADNSFSILRKLAPLDPDHRARFLALVKEHGWSKTRLEDEIRTWRETAKEAQANGRYGAALSIAAGDIDMAQAIKDQQAEKAERNAERRTERHQAIAAKAEVSEGMAVTQGQFPLIYADPPWTFQTFTPKGAESTRMPDHHYPTLSDDRIAGFAVQGIPVADLAPDDAALFLWCTSANLFRAIAILDAWGFTYKTHAVWDKMRIGTGLVFRNQHEVLLYGDRGSMPKPEKLFSSVFRYPRTTHSAKPPEVREAIEAMYPHFGEATRLELFARERAPGWSSAGNEV